MPRRCNNLRFCKSHQVCSKQGTTCRNNDTIHGEPQPGHVAIGPSAVEQRGLSWPRPGLAITYWGYLGRCGVGVIMLSHVRFACSKPLAAHIGRPFLVRCRPARAFHKHAARQPGDKQAGRIPSSAMCASGRPSGDGGFWFPNSRTLWVSAVNVLGRGVKRAGRVWERIRAARLPGQLPPTTWR